VENDKSENNKLEKNINFKKFIIEKNIEEKL
jgi:hypothetical protein